VNTYGVWTGNQIYWTLKHTTHNNTLQNTIINRLLFSVMVFTALLRSGFQRHNILGFHVQQFLSSLAGWLAGWLAPFSCSSQAGLAYNCRYNSQVKVKDINHDWQSVGQSVLVSGTHLGPILLSLITFRQLWVCWCGVLSLMREQLIVYSCCWASSAQFLSCPILTGLMTIFYCLKFETPPTWRARILYLFPLPPPPRNRVTQLYPKAMGLSN
jgi:hypothetical protein